MWSSFLPLWIYGIHLRFSSFFSKAHIVLVGTHLDDKYMDLQTLKKQLAEVRNIYHPQLAPGAAQPSKKMVEQDEEEEGCDRWRVMTSR